jgi:hypothetical protein
MTARSLAASLLLVAATFCTVQVVWDQATFHFPVRHEWRASAHHQGALRPLQRQAIGVAGVSSEQSVLSTVGRAPSAEPAHALSLFFAGVFVPPRV